MDNLKLFEEFISDNKKISLECTCQDITQSEWDNLMKGKRKLNYEWLVKKIKKDCPDIYDDLRLDLKNPYSEYTFVTKTHYILTHSSVEYFFRKQI